MEVLTSIAETRTLLRQLPRPLGLVPTMGFLHEGHLALVRHARKHNATVAVSIFVNPTQFGPNEDFSAYPRDMQRDLGLLRAGCVDLVFAPEVSEVYPPGFTTFVEVGPVSERLEGAARPGHFRGVATVVSKLFNIIQPDRAYFGQKDAQQVAVIQKLVSDLALPVEVVPLPTVREPDGLAMSSRNVYLTSPERQAATVLHRALCAAEARFIAGERNADRLRDAALQTLAAEPLARVDYVSVADPRTLDELEEVAAPALVSMAVRIGRARLIDNVVLRPE